MKDKKRKGIMMELFNIICGICSIAGLLVSIFTANKVVKITQTFHCGDKDDHSKQVNKISNSTIHGLIAGRDINGTGDSK